MRIFNLCGVTAALLLLSGCATMFTGTKQDIEVRTQNDVQPVFRRIRTA